MGILHLDINIGVESEADLLDGAAKVLLKVRPSWEKTNISWRFFTDGITNKLVGGWLKGQKHDTVLVRVYGDGTEKFIDRQVEVSNMLKLQDIGCGARVYATFNNGLCYEYIDGDILAQDKLEDPLVYKEVARMMAKMHSIPLSQNESNPCLWDRIENFIDISNPSCRDRLTVEFPSKDELRVELAELKRDLSESDCPIVFCHNDALLGNIVLRRDEGNLAVTFIDLEYGAANYGAFDIANHFCEFVSCEGKLDYDRWFPSREYQQAWIEEYLRAGGKGEVETLMMLVEKFVLASHLMWAVWAVIQTENSTIDFDFEDYAMQRISEFKRRKSLLKES